MTTVDLQNVSRWYGNVVAVNDISMTLDAGVTGLLGPNGAAHDGRLPVPVPRYGHRRRDADLA
jgi:ABC-type uncharacterized transport system ATPase subunit